MSETLRAAAVSIEQRIAEIDRLLAETEVLRAEIDRLLAETEVLRAEREHLARALEEVAAATDATAGAATSSPPPRARAARGGRTAGEPAGRAPRTSSGRRKRAPQGLNRERILAFLGEEGPAGASTIARATGIHRAVVYNNLGNLTGDGTVIRDDGEDGTSLFRLAR